ncbi:DUF4279 domain-containing protein [Pedobacter frigoris]|uniref:DUF4279 domain-containing protein n=1 Tax=Pedobacter frigoris TaxID=2571272 RepID=A0A4U1CNJ8_9SPHI|nr:DUF4279 domain-containing protein [Pedobacter frigoris]TKC09074.1 DUF4279 domain-containing protein [Pedobacter frigoris]
MENVTLALKIHDFECSIEAINKKLGIDATESWLKGEIIPNRDGSITRKNSSWIIKSSIENSEFINQGIDDLLMSINENELLAFSHKYLCELSIVMKCRNENNIGLNFNKEVIKKLSSLGIELDVDIYMLSNV